MKLKKCFCVRVPNKNNMRLCYTRQSVEKIIKLYCFREKHLRNTTSHCIAWDDPAYECLDSRENQVVLKVIYKAEKCVNRLSEEFRSVLYLIKVLLLAFSGLCICGINGRYVLDSTKPVNAFDSWLHQTSVYF